MTFYDVFESNSVRTLRFTQKTNGNLAICHLDTKFECVSVFSKGQEFKNDTKILELGDDVFTISKESTFFTFTHFKVIALTDTNNAKIVFRCNIMRKNYLNNLPAKYRIFIKNYFARHKHHLN